MNGYEAYVIELSNVGVGIVIGNDSPLLTFVTDSTVLHVKAIQFCFERFSILFECIFMLWVLLA